MRATIEATVKSDDALTVLQEKMDVVRGLFQGFDYSDYKTDALALLLPAANHILGLDPVDEKSAKDRFLDVMASVIRLTRFAAHWTKPPNIT